MFLYKKKNKKKKKTTFFLNDYHWHLHNTSDFLMSAPYNIELDLVSVKDRYYQPFVTHGKDK